MKSVLIAGLGTFGKYAARKMMELDNEVMAVDIDENDVNEILPYVTGAMIGDSTNEEFLRSLGANNYDVCLVAIGENFEASLETTALLKDLGAPTVISLANSDAQAKLLKKIGADEVVYPDRQLAEWTAITYSSTNIFDYIKLGNDYAIYELAVPEKWVGKNLIELDVRQKYHVSILALKSGDSLNMTIDPSRPFKPGNRVLVLGKEKEIRTTFKSVMK
ncbi:trk system potassium uptake protein TrkA [Lachnospiraceae bacterium]|nr:trk system potassium uptake protein TrkA [Lachnospiraceae bacterium]